MQASAGELVGVNAAKGAPYAIQRAFKSLSAARKEDEMSNLANQPSLRRLALFEVLMMLFFGVLSTGLYVARQCAEKVAAGSG